MSDDSDLSATFVDTLPTKKSKGWGRGEEEEEEHLSTKTKFVHALFHESFDGASGNENSLKIVICTNMYQQTRYNHIPW
ncbi:unnamed protein product, partial [marine sediment metagenome]